MNILVRQQHLLSRIENPDDQSVLKKLEHVMLEAKEKTDTYSIAREPITIDELRSRAINAHSAVMNGEFITHEDLKKEMDTW